MVARPMASMCMVLLTYVKPLAEVDVHRAAHVAWIEGLMATGTMLLAGRRSPPTGGVLLFRGEVDVMAEEAANDPFVQNGVATFEVIPFTATLAMNEIGDLF